VIEGILLSLASGLLFGGVGVVLRRVSRAGGSLVTYYVLFGACYLALALAFQVRWRLVAGADRLPLLAAVIGLSAKIEMELRQLPEDEVQTFLGDYGIARPAREKLIAETYRLMGLLSFFTVGADEVKAWTIRDGTKAVQAAGVIHSDIERGFIRAEVVSFDDFALRESLPECRSNGTLRLEGKDYPVRDGDIVNFRFAV